MSEAAISLFAMRVHKVAANFSNMPMPISPALMQKMHRPDHNR